MPSLHQRLHPEHSAHLIRRILPAVITVLILPSAGRIIGAPGAAAKITLRGIIHAHHRIEAIEAVERNRANVLLVSKNLPTPWLFPGTYHAHGGKFSIPSLPVSHTYDLIILTTHGRWEGVNMRYYRSVLPGPPATTGDIRQIANFIEKIPRFTNYNRPLWIAGDHNHATVVVEQLHTGAFVTGRAGSIIFRVAVWYFQRYHDAWSKVSNLGKVLTRWRGNGKQITNPWQYLPQLGGIRVDAAGHYRKINITLPKASPHHGLDGPIPHGH